MTARACTVKQRSCATAYLVSSACFRRPARCERPPRLACGPTDVSQLTQPGHCVTPTAHQLAFLACRDNGLSHIFEDTALSQLEALKEAGHKPEDAQQPVASEPLSVADSLNALLVQQVQAAREAEHQRAVEEILYLWCLHKLAEGDMAVTMSFAGDNPFDEQGGHSAVSQATLTRIMSAAVADAVVGLVGATFGDDQEDAQSGQLVARIDRTQAAKLYAGNIEYGYFVRGMEARCQAAGMSQYTDASQLINMAASLSEDALREAVRVRSKQAWHAAVRHTGLLYQLEPPPPITSQAVAHELPLPISIDEAQGNEAEAPAKQHQAKESVQSSLPYPQLQQTISNANFAPAAHLAEHYSPPGAAEEAARSAASKQARGWQADDMSQAFLPEPDLVALHLGRLKQLLLEATALGCMLWECEQAVEESGYPLQPFEHSVAVKNV